MNQYLMHMYFIYQVRIPYLEEIINAFKASSLVVCHNYITITQCYRQMHFEIYFVSGTRDGKLLKVLINQMGLHQPRKLVHSEESEVFRSKECSRNETEVNVRSPVRNKQEKDDDVKRVRKLVILKSSNVILVTFQHCIISVPLDMCHFYECKR